MSHRPAPSTWCRPRALLVRISPGASLAAAEDAVRSARPAPWQRDTAPDVVEIAVRYDGENLDAVGGLTGLGPAGVVEAHTGQVWTVAFAGFSPGFGYLVGDGRLDVGRRDTPRTSVPAGSVALAGGFTGVYPSDSPGGWHLIGTTSTTVWDVDRDPPALLAPGARVRFSEA